MNELFYATVAVIVGGVPEKQKAKPTIEEPAWKAWLQRQTEAYKKELSIIGELKMGVAMKAASRKAQAMLRDANGHLQGMSSPEEADGGFNKRLEDSNEPDAWGNHHYEGNRY